MNKGETMQENLERLERDLAAANLQFEEAREIIEQVSYSPEMKKHFYDGHWQDPHGVHAFTAKYAHKRGYACTYNAANQTPGHTMCLKDLPCPDHKE